MSNLETTTNASPDIFTPFNTPFARRIFGLCGVEDAHDLIGQHITLFSEVDNKIFSNDGHICSIAAVNHRKDESEESEIITLNINHTSLSWIKLSSSGFSGLLYFNPIYALVLHNDIDTQISFGLTKRILCKPGGLLGDEH